MLVMLTEVVGGGEGDTGEHLLDAKPHTELLYNYSFKITPERGAWVA